MILSNNNIGNAKVNNKETAMINPNEVNDSKIEIKSKIQKMEKKDEDPLIE